MPKLIEADKGPFDLLTGKNLAYYTYSRQISECSTSNKMKIAENTNFNQTKDGRIPCTLYVINHIRNKRTNDVVTEENTTDIISLPWLKKYDEWTSDAKELWEHSPEKNVHFKICCKVQDAFDACPAWKKQKTGTFDTEGGEE